MKVLHLDISLCGIDRILQGNKLREIREVRPKNKKYLLKSRDNKFLVDDKNRHVPKEYDAIMFHANNNNILIEICNAYLQPVLSDNGEQIKYLYKDDVVYAESVVYELGRIIKCKIYRDKIKLL